MSSGNWSDTRKWTTVNQYRTSTRDMGNKVSGLPYQSTESVMFVRTKRPAERSLCLGILASSQETKEMVKLAKQSPSQAETNTSSKIVSELKISSTSLAGKLEFRALSWANIWTL